MNFSSSSSGTGWAASSDWNGDVGYSRDSVGDGGSATVAGGELIVTSPISSSRTVNGMNRAHGLLIDRRHGLHSNGQSCPGKKSHLWNGEKDLWSSHRATAIRKRSCASSLEYHESLTSRTKWSLYRFNYSVYCNTWRMILVLPYASQWY